MPGLLDDVPAAGAVLGRDVHQVSSRVRGSESGTQPYGQVQEHADRQQPVVLVLDADTTLVAACDARRRAGVPARVASVAEDDARPLKERQDMQTVVFVGDLVDLVGQERREPGDRRQRLPVRPGAAVDLGVIVVGAVSPGSTIV